MTAHNSEPYYRPHEDTRLAFEARGIYHLSRAPERNPATDLNARLIFRLDARAKLAERFYTARKSLQGEAHKKLVVRIMKDLENAGWLRTAEQGADGPARCSVNPMIHARFTARAEWERRDREAKRAAIEKSAQAKRWLTDETSGK